MLTEKKKEEIMKKAIRESNKTGRGYNYLLVKLTEQAKEQEFEKERENHRLIVEELARKRDDKVELKNKNKYFCDVCNNEYTTKQLSEIETKRLFKMNFQVCQRHLEEIIHLIKTS